MMSFKYGVLDVRNLPGSDDAVCDKILLASAQSETEISESGLIALLKLSDKILADVMVR